MSLFTYEIAAPTNVIEASASTDPDDVSKAYIRIEAKAPDNKVITNSEISEIRFEINVLSASDKDDDEKKRDALTRNPGNITPVAKDFGRWTFSAPGEKSIFVARPKGVTNEADVQTLATSGEVLVFYLYDIEVIDRDGETKITVTEVDGEGNKIPDTIPELVIRKIFPALRIDYFKADKLAVKAGTKVKLEWATTSATKILLSGITTTDTGPTSGNPTAVPDPVWDGFQILETNLLGQQVAQKDGTFFVGPETTTTYTLQARSNNADTVAFQQLTIRVSDQLQTNRLTGEKLEIQSKDGIISTSGSQIQTNGIRITSNNDNIRSHVPPGSLQVSGTTTLDGNLLVSGRADLDGDVYINKGISNGNRAKIRATGDIDLAKRTSGAKLHFDLLDSSDASGWTEDVLVLHGNGHVKIGSGEVNVASETVDSYKVNVAGSMIVSEKVMSLGGLSPIVDTFWQKFNMRPSTFWEWLFEYPGLGSEAFFLDSKVLYKTDHDRIYDVTNQVQISYLKQNSNPNTLVYSMFCRGFKLSSLQTDNYGEANYGTFGQEFTFYDGHYRILLWKVPCAT